MTNKELVELISLLGVAVNSLQSARTSAVVSYRNRLIKSAHQLLEVAYEQTAPRI